MLRIPYYLDNQLTDGVKVVSPKHQPRSTPQKHYFSSVNYFSASDTHFYWRLSEPQGRVRPEGLGKLKKSIDLMGSRTDSLPACSIVPQPLRYRMPPLGIRKGKQSVKTGPAAVSQAVILAITK
jgi:hypothetical protein